MGWGERNIQYSTVQYISLIREGEGEEPRRRGEERMMTMRRFLLKREVAAISDWGLEKERTKEKRKKVCGCVQFWVPRS